MSEWISVKDRLPEEGITVLTYEGNYIRSAEILYFEDDGTPQWLDGGVVFDGVTHWMPLPSIDSIAGKSDK